MLSECNPMWLFNSNCQFFFPRLLLVLTFVEECLLLIFWGGGLCMQKQSGERCEVAKTWDALALSRAETLEWRFARACIIMHKSFYVNPDVVARYGLLEVSRVLSTHPASQSRAGIYRNMCCRQKICRRMPWDQKANFLVNSIALY